MIDKAIKVLNINWRGHFTIPSKKLYPFQWFWDSGFIAIGLAHFNIDRAKKEISTLLDAQWENGFIPHIIFHTPNDDYFPGADFHRADLHELSLKKYKSTGMTQPPITGFVLEEIYNIAKDKKDILNFIASIIDKVYLNHEYFYKHRDLDHDGLVYIYHNWESGTDNSPIWDDIWETMDPPNYNVLRKDTLHVNESQRPTIREYDYYLSLIDLAKKHKYDDKAIAQNSPFLVQDPLFNSILIKSNKSLVKLYKILGKNNNRVEQLNKWIAKSTKSVNSKLFNESIGAYVHFDLVKNQQIMYCSSSSFSPIFAGIPDRERAKIMLKTMLDSFGSEHMYLCASFDPRHKKFDSQRYWRGPVWINLNWMLYKGFKEYGFTTVADRLKNDALELVKEYGFYEYFECKKSKTPKAKGGYGGENFSWTAALIIDLLKNK
jgi:glycogen debranching enzyme